MSIVVNTNIGSLNAQRSLASSSNELQTAMERLSSGKKINSAADDAAGFAIAERMTAQVRGLNMATKNANDGLSMLAVIENATNDVTDMLQRMRELAVQAANDTNSATDRGYLQEEADALLAEINRVASQTQYNGQTVLDGNYQNKAIQVGTDAGQTIEFSVASLSISSLGAGGYDLVSTGEEVGKNLGYYAPWNTSDIVDSEFGGGFADVGYGAYVAFGDDLSQHFRITGINMYGDTKGGDNVRVSGDASGLFGMIHIVEQHKSVGSVDLINDADDALSTISRAIEQVSGQRAEYGALQNRLEYTVSNLMNVSEFTTAARSRIEDADFAAESARLAKAQVLQQTGTAMLAQANSSSQLVLSLVR